MQSTNLNSLINELQKEIPEDILQNEFPIDDYLRKLDNYPDVSAWDYISPKVRFIENNIRRKYDDDILGIYHKLILASLISKNREKQRINQQLKGVDHHYDRFFNLVINRLISGSGNAGYHYSVLRFRFEINICRGFIVPMVPQYINPDIASRGVLFKKGIGQFLRGAFFILFKFKGVRPIFKLHLNSNDAFQISKFNENGWREEFKQIAKILMDNPKIKGIMGTTWFFDPHLKEISPDIAYIINLLHECKALILYNGTDMKSTQEAIFLNKNRKEKYNKGIYKPTKYTAFISRNELLSWYERNWEN